MGSVIDADWHKSTHASPSQGARLSDLLLQLAVSQGPLNAAAYMCMPGVRKAWAQVHVLKDAGVRKKAAI